MNDLVLIRKNLFRRKLRAVLMMVSILIAFAIFAVLASFERAFNAGQDRATPDRLVVLNKINFTQPLPISYYNRVAAIDGVAQITHFSWFGGYYQEPRNFIAAFAVDPENWMKLRDSDFVFPPEVRAAFIRERTGVLVGARMMEKWGWKIGDHIPISSSIWSQKNGSHAWDFIIVGSFTARIPQADTNVMLMGYDYFNETRSFGKDLINWLALRTTSVAANERVTDAIDGMFANSPYETTTDSEKAFNKAFAAQLGNVALIVELVVGAAFVTILMIVGNTMVMTVRERTREIGVLKTLGFPGGRILRLVLGESILLALLGGLPGLCVALLLITRVRDSLMSFVPTLSLYPDIAAAAVGLMVVFGIITGLVPALNAMRLNIVTALGRS
ncbi:FtsX-like permease family protein [Bradyrhizobium manausense]|uniref:ABC transporter permease n=1 Tax=Bradyrhizobium manausense TaxID=989370 RepID=UPI001BAD2339|nr:FtsX-like permease family protein [Bradyrhizobium manausense]MBR0835881.1 FtsX-like permease family protein [Bradyrhizobium manausense]